MEKETWERARLDERLDGLAGEAHTPRIEGRRSHISHDCVRRTGRIASTSAQALIINYNLRSTDRGNFSTMY